MAKVLDFNAITGSMLDLTMADEAHTVLHLDYPTEELVRELMGLDLESMKKGDQAGVSMVYDLAARLINHNLDYVTVTAEELRGKYGLNLRNVIVFYSAYLDAINQLANEKNLGSRTTP